LRREQDKIVQAGTKVTLGGKEYLIKPLVIRDSLPWCDKVVEMMKRLPQYAKVTTNSESFGDVVEEMYSASPKYIIDLFFEYAKDLDEEEIRGKASSAEIMAAYEEVLKLEAPFFSSLTRTAVKIAPR